MFIINLCVNLIVLNENIQVAVGVVAAIEYEGHTSTKNQTMRYLKM